MFQSLSRDSVCLDAGGDRGGGEERGVSIPESGFCLFGPAVVAPDRDPDAVSIPESGFCLFGLRHRPQRHQLPLVSIPESGFCLFGPPPSLPGSIISVCFNP